MSAVPVPHSVRLDSLQYSPAIEFKCERVPFWCFFSVTCYPLTIVRVRPTRSSTVLATKHKSTSWRVRQVNKTGGDGKTLASNVCTHKSSTTVYLSISVSYNKCILRVCPSNKSWIEGGGRGEYRTCWWL